MTDPARREVRRNHVLELVSACLLGLATVGSAWCAYQASRWSEEAVEQSKISDIARVEGTRLHSLAATTITYDTDVITSYADAVSGDRADLAELYRETLVRREFLPILDRWEAEVAQGKRPANLLDDSAYLDDLFGPYRIADEKADLHSGLGLDADRNARDHVLTTVLLAVGLFFAGVTNVFRGVAVKLTAVTCAGFVVAFAAARLSELPVL